jgi:hypothetical protein
VSIIKEGGRYFVALIGMAAGYFGNRRTGLESRHHVRVEALYQDMLDELANRRQQIVGASLQRLAARCRENASLVAD